MRAPDESTEDDLLNKLLTSTLITALAMLLSAHASADYKDDIAERLKRVGGVCIAGDDCGSGIAGGTSTASAAGGLESNYNSSCGTCHAAGVAGAPKFGSAEDWEARIATGMDVLYDSAINGKGAAMPAKGLCFTCSDDELKALVDYMISGGQ